MGQRGLYIGMFTQKYEVNKGSIFSQTGQKIYVFMGCPKKDWRGDPKILTAKCNVVGRFCNVHLQTPKGIVEFTVGCCGQSRFLSDCIGRFQCAWKCIHYSFESCVNVF